MTRTQFSPPNISSSNSEDREGGMKEQQLLLSSPFLLSAWAQLLMVALPPSTTIATTTSNRFPGMCCIFPAPPLTEPRGRSSPESTNRAVPLHSTPRALLHPSRRAAPWSPEADGVSPKYPWSIPEVSHLFCIYFKSKIRDTRIPAYPRIPAFWTAIRHIWEVSVQHSCTKQQRSSKLTLHLIYQWFF